MRRLNLLLLFFGFLLHGLVLTATRPVDPELQSGNEELEWYLEKAGIGTDIDSLIRVARTGNDLVVRSFAVELLGSRGDRKAIPTLEAVYELDPESLIREAAAIGLASMAVPGAVAKLEHCLENNPRGLGRQAYLAIRLLELGDPIGYSYVVAAALSADPNLRSQASLGLVRFAAAGETGTDAETAPLTLLAKLLNDPVASVRRAVIVEVSVGESRGVIVAEWIAKIGILAKEDPDSEVRSLAEAFVHSHKPANP